jgi:uncharacterized protein YbjT (DUF2867 family)
LIFSATEDGQVPFVIAGDIAAVAEEVLTDESFPSGDTILTGLELLTYNQVAAITDSVALYQVQHFRLTLEEMARKWASAGMPDQYAAFVASLDTQIAGGSEAQLSGEVSAPPDTSRSHLRRSLWGTRLPGDRERKASFVFPGRHRH